MRPARRATTYMALSAIAALTLAGCAAGTAGDGGSPTGRAAQTTAASPPASVIPVATSSPAPAGPVTFTFPDGRLSFQHPKGWHVELFEASASPYVGTATVSDPTGGAHISVYTGEI